MAPFTSWLDAVSSEPLLLHGAVYEGLHRLGYVKPEQFDAVKSLWKGEDVSMSVPTGLESLLCTRYCCFAQKAPSLYLYIWVQVSIRGSDQSDQLGETS